MGSTVIDAIPVGSIDRWGLSVVTAKGGSIYHPGDFAAAIPIHFHPHHEGGPIYLGLFDRYWTDAVPATGAVGRYSSHTAVVAPAAGIVDAANGTIGVPDGLPGYSLGFRLPTWSTARLVNAASQSSFVYLLLSTDVGTTLSLWRTGADGFVVVNTITVPDIIADGQTVNFARGVYLDGPYLYLWGEGLSDHRVYTARQFASRIGIDPWTYQSDTGWSVTGATSVTGLFTRGPMSSLVFRKRTFVTTVALLGGNYVGQIWTSRSMGDPWVKIDERIINSSATWLGNGLMLQPQVRVNYDALPPEVIAGIPMTWTQAATDGGAGLDVFWDLLTIPKSMA